MFQFVSKRVIQLGFLFLLIASFNQAFSQQNTVASLVKPDGSARPDKVAKPESKDSSDQESILASFVAAENRVREALNQHTFKRDVVLQTIGPNGEVTGEYIRNSQFLFDDRGKRIEKVLFHPASTIREMRITKEDIQDLAGSQLLGIDIVEATKYRLSYIGAETIDSHQLVAIDVTPLTEPDPKHMSERFFVGRVWVDPTTFQIVKALAFPTRTEADEVLHFQGRDVHYRIKVRYYEYKLFGSKVSVTEVDGPFPDVDETTPNPNEAPPKMNQAPPRTNATPKVKETHPKLSEKPSAQLPFPKIQPQTKPAVCTTNRNAPPVGGYHWPADTEVKVYFVRNMFTPEQGATLLEAMKTWTVKGQEDGSGVKFTYAGETERRMSCRSCLTVGRRDVYKQDKHHYAFFNPMQAEGQLLVSAWIDLDFGIKDPTALQGFMAHELGHGLGLWDCPSCKNKQSLMNSFPGLNKNNGLVAPSSCDLATMRSVYQEERQIAAANSYGAKRPEAVRVKSTSALPMADLEKAGFSALNLPRSLVGGAEATKSLGDRRQTIPVERPLPLPLLSLDRTGFSVPDFRHSTIDLRASVNPFSDKRPGTGLADSALTLKPFTLNKSTFYLFDLHHPRVKPSLFLWNRLF